MTAPAAPPRGADHLVAGLLQAGVRSIFTRSGNHIMPVFDAAFGTDLRLVHVRHEAAAVHMADAFARLTGTVGVAMVTGGQGHANALGALCTALAGEVPMVLLSGHAPLRELGLGAFQEIPQAELAAPLTKASWPAQSAASLPADLARACRIARFGRPGPVHISLPSDVLEDRAEDVLLPDPAAFLAEPVPLPSPIAGKIIAALVEARRPLILAPPALCTRRGRQLLAHLQAATGAPVVAMESPRGIADPSLGAFAEVLARADLVVLLGKALDFTLRFGRAPAVAADCRWIVVDPDAALRERARAALGERLLLAGTAGAREAAEGLIESAEGIGPAQARRGWDASVAEALALRMPVPDGAGRRGPIHPAVLCAALRGALADQVEATFVSDGGEIGQWAQAVLAAPHRVINGVAGAIGPALPFAAAASLAHPGAPVVAVLGDGTAGFHIAEFDTAVRYGLPLIAVIGNDSRWSAEHQIQLRDYGAARAYGCELLPATRYDRAAAAFGAHGEFVTCFEELGPALARALASGKPACLNVLIESVPAPIVRRA